MQLHASCAASQGHGVLVTGPSGTGKSDLILQLIASGFVLVADDQVILTDGHARAPARLAGMLEVWGVGIIRLPYLRAARPALEVRLGPCERLPGPGSHDMPTITLAPRTPDAPARVRFALAAALHPGRAIAGSLARHGETR